MQYLAFLIGISLFMAGCRDQEGIQTYRAPKETTPQIPGFASESAANKKEIDWVTPTGWIEQSASAMRVGSFLVKGKNGQSADISVVPLSGPAGGSLSNINRWRGQISLEPISDDQLAANSRTVDAGGRKMLWVDFVSRDKLINKQYKLRLVAAIYTQGERTWFFKMMGEDQTVQDAIPSFQRFLETLRFHEPH